MMRLLCCLAALALLFASAAAKSDAAYTDLLIGTGIWDVTGTAAEAGFMGYAMPDQKANGIHLRQRSRAFIFAEPSNPTQRVVYVSSDICMVYQMVKQHVIEQLQSLYGPTLYTLDNVMLSGTHTHAGPAGYAYYILYDVSSLGFIKENHQVIVEGITAAIVQAHNSLAKRIGGRVLVSTGTLWDTNTNRSPTSYLSNPDTSQYPDGNTDKLMTMLRLQDQNGTDIASIAFFPVHGTSMNNTNGLISGDNKGYAAYSMERHFNGNVTPPGFGPFIAAFGQSNEGDVSPNVNGTHCPDGTPCTNVTSTCGGKTEGCQGYGPGADDFQSTEIIGQRQADMALQLWSIANDTLGSGISYVHQWVNMPSVVVPANWTNSSKPMQLCRGALGDSFAGGTTDGPGAFDFTQGTNSTNKNPYWNFIADFIFDATEEDKACQAPKPILLNVGGLNFPAPWAPSTLPLQIFRIGTLYLVGVPGEFTTMSGRRLRNAVTAALESAGAQQPFYVVIAGLVNSYSHYIATYEEYLDQRYEAASTLYGPNTLAAYEYLYSGLAMDLQLGVTPPAGPPPPYLNFTFTFLPPVIEDRLPSGKNFGDVLEDVSSSPYSPGDAVFATFQGANPRNNLRTQDSFLRVEMSTNGGAQWNPVLLDGDWETKFHWAKGGLMESVITLEWDIPSWTPSGTYRLRYNGDWKALNGTITTFTGVSSSFQVVNNQL